MSKRLKYNDDDSEVRRMIQVFRSMNYNWSKEDDEYTNNMNECMKDCELKNVEDCLQFFALWTSIYKETKKNWETTNE